MKQGITVSVLRHASNKAILLRETLMVNKKVETPSDIITLNSRILVFPKDT